MSIAPSPSLLQRALVLRARAQYKLKTAGQLTVVVLLLLSTVVWQQPITLADENPPSSNGCRLEITKAVDKTTANPGATLTYTITVRNTGTEFCTGGGVKIEDDLDPRLDFVSETHSPNLSNGYGCPLGQPGGCGPVLNGSTLTWSGHEMAPGSSGTITWLGRVKEPAVCGTFTIPNTARTSSREYNWQWLMSNTVNTTVTKPCTGQLIVIKHVINNNGGTVLAPGFTMNVTAAGLPGGASSFPGSEAGVTLTVQPGAYSVDETAVTGYTKTLSADCTGTITAGQTKICTITNDDVPPSLTLIKQVTGGTALHTAWTLTATGSVGSPTNLSGTTPVASGASFRADTYTLAETTGPAGYTASLYSCVKNGGVAVASNSITLSLGDTAICTITNTFLPPDAPRLTVIKHVINDNGGTALAGAFTMNVTGAGGFANSFPGVEAPGTTITMPVGAYSVDETSTLTTYAKTLSADCTGTIAAGQTKTCTVTNNDNPPVITTLIVKKIVSNDNGGTKTSADFTMQVTGTNPSPASFPGSATGTSVTIVPGTYSVDEAAMTGYTKSFSADCTGTIAAGQTKTCTITNNDNPPDAPRLIIIKHVINDNGGTVLAPGFTMNVTGAGGFANSFAGAEAPGVTLAIPVGAYSVDEVVLAGYTKTLSADCSATIAAGQTKTCTTTNDDAPLITTRLIVIKHVINDNGGSKVAADFTMNVTAVGLPGGASSFPGSETGVTLTVQPGAYSVDEGSAPGYAKSAENTCSGAIAAGETKSCTITNNDQGGGGGCTSNCGGGGGGCTGASCNPNPSPVNASITCGPSATLSFSYGSDVTQISISNDPNFTSGTTTAPAPSATWQVPVGSGHSVYVKFTRGTGSVEIRTATTNSCETPPPPPQVLGCTNLVVGEKELVKNVNQSFVNQSKGKLLSQVEAHKELWYVDPGTGKKFFLPEPGCYSVVELFAVGISNVDLSKIPVGLVNYLAADTDGDGLSNELEQLLGTDPLKVDTDGDGYSDEVEVRTGHNPNGAGTSSLDSAFAAKQKGRFFLQVESNGELWYIAGDGKRYFVPHTAEACHVLGTLAEGTKNEKLRSIPVGFEVNGINTTELAPCFEPTPQVLGAELPRTGFPLDGAQLAVLPVLAAYPWVRRRYGSALNRYFAKLS